MSAADALTATRQAAAKIAAAELERRQFLKKGNDWIGSLELPGGGKLSLRVSIPSGFPDSLPEIFVLDHQSFGKALPHIEADGKICIAPTTGVLLDATKPDDLVAAALDRAGKTVADGLSGKNAEDFYTEFLAYWLDGTIQRAASIVTVDATPRPVCLLVLQDEGHPRLGKFLFADTAEQGKDWLDRVGDDYGYVRESFYLPLSKPFLPPAFGQQLSVQGLYSLISDDAPRASIDSVKAWIQKSHFPLTVLISMPIPGDRGRALIAAHLPEPSGDDKKRADAGFRQGNVPTWIALRRTANRVITKVRLSRLDPQYLLQRGGGQPELMTKTIGIVGCGAIGSYLADQVAALGIGKIRLIDSEVLSDENIHRHRLGINSLHVNKAKALALSIGRRLPHIVLECREKRIEDLILEEPQFITTVDLLAVCLGDETLELRLNTLLKDQVRRVHVWVEPLGLGGHVLATGITKSVGCFRCLFEESVRTGNQSALAAHGQSFHRSLAGCGGEFTPFPGYSAQRASLRAVELIGDVLLGQVTTNLLVSGMGNSKQFLSQGFQLSARGRSLRPNEEISATDFGRRDCPDCGHLGT